MLCKEEATTFFRSNLIQNGLRHSVKLFCGQKCETLFGKLHPPELKRKNTIYLVSSTHLQTTISVGTAYGEYFSAYGTDSLQIWKGIFTAKKDCWAARIQHQKTTGEIFLSLEEWRLHTGILVCVTACGLICMQPKPKCTNVFCHYNLE